jgi:hypothetical protein
MKIQTGPRVPGIFLLIIIVCLFAPVHSATQTQDIQKEIKRQNLRITKLLQPSAKQKVAQAAQTYENRVISSNWQVDYHQAAVEAVRSQFGNLQSTGGIDALVQLVMFELWRAEDAALEEMLEEMHRMNQVKKRQREYINQLKKQRASAKKLIRQEYQDLKKQSSATTVQQQARIVKKPPKTAVTCQLRISYPKTPTITNKDAKNMTLVELDKYVEEKEQELDSLGGLSEELSLKLQILMDRRSKIIQTLSNILKKISQTSDSIISNIK